MWLFPVLAALAVGCSDDGGHLGDTGGVSGTAGASGGGPGEPQGDDSGWGSAGGTTGAAGDSWGDEPGPDDSGAPDDTGGADDTGSTSDDSTTGETTDGAACDAETPVVLYLSPDDSNSTASPVMAREAVLGDWGGLTYAPIRTWEFLNYYGFDYEPADAGKVRVVPEIGRVDGVDEQYILQIGVSAETVPNADRPLMNVTLVLDESGSMEGEPIELEREVCRQIAASLRKGDVVSMVGWDTTNAVKLAGHVVTAASDPKLVALCDELAAGGGTDLNGGLTAGYALAHEHFSAGRINRLVLISDGGANVGVTDEALIAEGAGAENEDGIYLVGVGVGVAGQYNDLLMDTVTDIGKGASLFIPHAAEAKKMFGERFVSTMMVAARDVQVRLELPPGFEIVKFSGEEYSADPQEVEPQHLAPNDAMVFHQTLSTCAPALVDDEASFTVTARYQDAVSFEQREVVETRKIKEALQGASPTLLKGAAVYAYAEALKSWKLAEVGAQQTAALEPAFKALDVADAALPSDADLAEIRGVLEALQSN